MNKKQVVDLLESNKVKSVSWIDPDKYGVSHTLQVCGNTNFIILFDLDIINSILIGDVEIYADSLGIYEGNLKCYSDGIGTANIPLINDVNI